MKGDVQGRCPYRVGRCGQCDWCVSTLLGSLARQHAWIAAAAHGRAFLEATGGPK